MRTDKSNKQIHVDFSPLSKIFVIEILNNFSINRIMINWDSGHCQIDQKSKNVKFIAKTMYSDFLMKQNMFNENTIKFNMPYIHLRYTYRMKILTPNVICLSISISCFSFLFCFLSYLQAHFYICMWVYKQYGETKLCGIWTWISSPKKSNPPLLSILKVLSSYN